MTTLINIRCPSLRLTISREACGAQVTRPYAPAVCRGCDVGAAHARGEAPTCWPDGSAIEEVEHEVARAPVGGGWKPPAAPRYAPAVHRLSTAPANPTGRNGRRAERYPYRGAELTALELSRLPEAVVDVETIRRRLRNPKRWSAERAVTTGTERTEEHVSKKLKTMTVPADLQRRIEDEAAAMGVAPVQVLRACIEVAMRREDQPMLDLVLAVEDECRKARPGQGLRVLR